MFTPLAAAAEAVTVGAGADRMRAALGLAGVTAAACPRAWVTAGTTR